MLGRGEDRQSPDGGGATAGREPIGALRERLDQDETIVYRIEGSGPVVCERDGERERLPEAESGDALAALTDRRWYFVLVGPSGVELVEVPYRDVRSVDADGGLLRSRLSVRVWNRGTYRLPAGRRQDVAGAADFAKRASVTYQRVLAALESAREHVTELGKYVEDGDERGVARSHEAIREQLSLARTRIDNGPDPTRDALQERVRAVATELQRTRMRAHLARGQTLVREGDRLTDREAWDDAVAAYTSAGEHLGTAHDVSTTLEFGLGESIQTEMDRLTRRTEMLGDLPLQLAEDARAAAQGADTVERAVPAWAAALEHYRAALTAGWGTPIEFAGETEELRMQVEWTAANLIDARRELAETLRREGDDHRMAGEDEAARDRYEAALDQLAAAARVAGELRAGDPTEIAAQREEIRERLVAVRPTADAGSSNGGAGGRPDDPESTDSQTGVNQSA